MSDFDRDAERERLREKYEADRRERQSTQRMSELLLKGATMTNRHCDECGDPVFRYDGTEFCPTCQHEAATGGDAATDGTADAATDAPAATGDAGPADADRAAGDLTNEADAVGAETASATADGDTDADVPDVTTGGEDVDPQPVGTDATGTDPSAAPAGRTDRPTADAPAAGPDQSGERRRDPARPERPSAAADDGEGRAAARASLERSLVRFARAAEGTDDPRRARDLLAAAREAAEALAALDRR